jgi:hypothetical protein
LGGTNAHVVLEEQPATAAPQPAGDGVQLITVSAADAQALTESLERLRCWAARHPGSSIADVAATLRRGRKHLPYRAVLACADVKTLAAAAPEDWARGGPDERPVIFALPGQGTQILEVHRQRTGPPGPRRRLGVAKHLAEIDVCVGRIHFPQRTAEPVPDQLQVVGVVADRAVDQTGRGSREHEPRQHIGLELGELLLAHRFSVLAQIAHHGQSQPTPPRLHPD